MAAQNAKGITGNIVPNLSVPRGTDPSEFGRDYERALEKEHDNNPNQPRKLILLCDVEVKKDLTDKDVTDPTKLFPRANWADFRFMKIAPNLTDIYHLYQMLQKNKGNNSGYYQEVHYQTGVGTDWDVGDMANFVTAQTGLGLAHRIRAGYTWICNRYRPGDKIYLVGFSRGALIARSVGGWIVLQGLLKRKEPIMTDDSAILDMYEKYKKRMPSNTMYKPGDDRVYPDIEAEIVFDTVPGLGLLSWNIFMDIPLTLITQVTQNYEHLHDLKLHKKIKNAWHALSLTDHKAPFLLYPYEKDDDNTVTNLEQCWFPGEHEDIGGGQHSDLGIPFMTMAWLMDKVSADLAFDEVYFDAIVQRLVQYYLNDKSTVDPLANGKVREWGLAQTHDTQRDQSLLGITALALMQKSDRKPGWYYRMDDRDCETSEALTNTNEKMHSSVRLRYGHPQKKFLGASGRGQFNPYALNNWEPVKVQSPASGNTQTGGTASTGGASAAPEKYAWHYSSSWYGEKTIPEAEMKPDGWETRLMKALHKAATGEDLAKQDLTGASLDPTSGFLKSLLRNLHRDV